MRINFRVLATALTLWFVSVPEKTFAQTTYWIPAIKSNGKTKTLDYSVKVPDFFVPWVKQINERGGQEVSKTINGTKYTFVQQGFSWDNGKGGSNPTSTGQIRIDNKKLRYQSDAWQSHQDFRTQKDFNAALDALSVPAYTNWREVDLLVLKWAKATAPNLQEPFDDTLLEIQKTLDNLAKQTKAGTYYEQVPVELGKFRAQMLTIGNLGRRDPDYRKKNGCKYAADLTGDTAMTDKGAEKIYKHRQKPPYFDDLVLNDILNNAAQFQAEYQATIKMSTHAGPMNYMGKDLSTFGKRLQQFGYKFATEGEGAGGGGVGSFPTWWMKSDSHFRPWFNIGADVREVGLGAAKAADGTWYFCVISGMGAR